MDKYNDDYWRNNWHNDRELHSKLGIKDVTKIEDYEPVSVYGDSVDAKSFIITDNGKFTIEELYNNQNNISIRKDKEVIPVNFKSLNWTEDNKLHFSKVKNIIRHKTSKKKWKISAGSEEVIITSDHSLIVIRNDEKINIKPNEVKSGDKILICK